jgi:processive 1,2-diacylglycerol beta-glucosyltransferase
MPTQVLPGTSKKVLILTVPHGAAHIRAARALEKALTESQSGLTVTVVDALEHFTAWFRRYYNSYEIPLRYWPTLWRWIEGLQQSSKSTSPGWLYRGGAKPLFRFFQAFRPATVVATEVGLCELASLYKREHRASFHLVAVELMDFYPAWVQPEVDLYLTSHPDLSAELAAAGAPREKIVCSGQPIDPIFLSLLPPKEARARLGIAEGIPLLLVLFGGGGYGNPLKIVPQLERISLPLQTVFIAGRNRRLENQLRRLCQNSPHLRVLGWVNNLHEWMMAADLMLSKPGGATLAEGFACGLPMLAFDPLPGNEERTCQWIEKWKAGRWVRKAPDLAPTIEALLTAPDELAVLRARALALARPRASDDAADAIVKLTQKQDPEAS